MKTEIVRKIAYIISFAWIVLIGFAAISIAEAPYWKSIPLRLVSQKTAGLTGGEGFQQVFAIAYAPSNPTIVYLSTDTSQIWKSTDGGSTWNPKNKGFMSNGARSIIVDPKNANIVFAAGFWGSIDKRAKKATHRFQGIYRSLDGGENWVFLRSTDFFRLESKGSLFAFDSSSVRHDRTPIIYAGSYNEGLLCSENGGDTWRSVGFRGKHIADLEENPANPGELFVATQEGFYSYFKGNAKRIGSGLPSWPRSIAVGPQNPNLVYATVGKGGVYRSSNNGKSFKAANHGLSLGINYTDIAVSPVASEIVYLKAHQSSLTPRISHDGARTWHEPVSTDLGNLISGPERFWFSSPFAPHPTEAMTALMASNGKGIIYKTSDGGLNWSYSGNGFTGGRMLDIAFSEDGKMVFCLTDHGLWLTQDQGDTFREIKVKKIFNRKSSRSGDVRGNTIVVSLGQWVKKGLAVSQDFGKSWQTFEKLVDRYDFIKFHPDDDTIIYAGPYRSRNKGKNWTKLTQTIRAMYSGNGDIVYAISAKYKKRFFVLKSYNKGDRWIAPYPVCPFPAKTVVDVAVAPNDSDRIYIGTSRGLWILDEGKWILRNHHHGLSKDYFGQSYVGPVRVDPDYPHIIYAGRMAPERGRSNGIFRSSDHGMTWKNINYNLGAGITIHSIQISPLDGAVYIGTSHGTFRLEGTDPDKGVSFPKSIKIINENPAQ
jgi:photosystem II stability/assembly factor-like uncharacterized protein